MSAPRPTPDETIALLTATLEAVHDGVLVVDLSGRVIFHNEQYLRMFGFTAGELARGGAEGIIAALIPQIENLEELRETSHALRDDPALTVLDVVRFLDGRVFERYVAPHRIGDTIVGRVASFRDIGPTVRAAEAVERHRAYLEQAQAVAHVGSWVAELDGSGRLGWSVETHRIFGVPLGQFEGTSDAFFALVHVNDRDTVRAASAAAVEESRPYEIEHRIVRTDGTIRWVHEQADVIRDAKGRPVRMIGVVQDITERRDLEDQFRQAQKMEAIGRLAGGIAHDLNNALTAIAGYAELALGEISVNHQARRDVEEIKRGAERAASVTAQLLAFSRKQLIAPRLFDLNDTVSGLARLLSRLLGADVEVRTTLAAALPSIVGDPGQVEQAIINLAVNARDAMPHGGRLELTTSIDDVDETFARAHMPMPPGRYVALRVTDTGHGMSRETQARIFEPFFTTKDVGKGTGLGLSMVYGTLKQIGGFVFVDSAVNRGTTFRLYFPPAAVQPAAPAEAVESNTAAPARSRRGPETVMVVEDETAVRNFVASALRDEGYRLLLAASADEAARVLRAHEGPIDLLLTDAIMPGKSGIELASTMLAERPGLPVIIMSGYTKESLHVRGLTEPVNLLRKPFSPTELRRRIRSALKHAS